MTEEPVVPIPSICLVLSSQMDQPPSGGCQKLKFVILFFIFFLPPKKIQSSFDRSTEQM